MLHVRFVLFLILVFVPSRLGARPFLRSCDLIFVGPSQARGEDSMDGAIAASTSERGDEGFTHVAMVERRLFRIWVIDATPQHGVSRRRLKAFIQEQNPDAVMEVKRFRRLRELPRRKVIDKAKTYLWQSYDFTFMPDNGMMYCSELIRECFLGRDGRYLFEAAPMNFLASDGSLPEFWHELFESLESEVPQGVPGTNPQDMSASPGMITVCRL